MKFFVFLYTLLLISLPRLSDSIFLQFTPLILLVIFIFIYQHKVNFNNFHLGKSTILIIFIIAVSILRTNNPNTQLIFTLYKVIEFCAFIYTLIIFYSWYINDRRKDPFDLIIYGTILPFTIYGICNISLWIFNVKFSNYEELDIGKSVLLSYFGLEIDRVQFPLVSGINSFAAVIGSVFVVSLISFFYSKKHKYLLLFSNLIFFFILLLTDSRSGLVYPIISIFILFVLRKFKIKQVIRILPYMILIAPVVLVSLIQLMATFGLLDLYLRESEDAASGNGRFLIWGISFQKFLDFKLVHLIGYGEYGHYASKASLDWAFLFGRWKNSTTVHPHNTLIMILFDYGYIGLLVFILFLRMITLRIMFFWHSNQMISNILTGYLLYFIFISTTESLLGLYYLNSIYVFFSICLVLIVIEKNIKSLN